MKGVPSKAEPVCRMISWVFLGCNGTQAQVVWAHVQTGSNAHARAGLQKLAATQQQEIPRHFDFCRLCPWLYPRGLTHHKSPSPGWWKVACLHGQGGSLTWISVSTFRNVCWLLILLWVEFFTQRTIPPSSGKLPQHSRSLLAWIGLYSVLWNKENLVRAQWLFKVFLQRQKLTKMWR